MDPIIVEKDVDFKTIFPQMIETLHTSTDQDNVILVVQKAEGIHIITYDTKQSPFVEDLKYLISKYLEHVCEDDDLE